MAQKTLNDGELQGVQRKKINDNFAEIYDELPTNITADIVGYNQGGDGAIDRTVAERLQDRISVNDFDVVGDGVTDDTEEFEAAQEVGVPVYVPTGTYLVDMTNIDARNFFGEGVLINNGVQISLNRNQLLQTTVQRKTQDLGFGFGGSLIFTGAELAPQGLARVDVGGVPKVYLRQRTAGASRTVDERNRIVEYNYTDDGSQISNVTFSEELAIGHQGLSAFDEGGSVVLYGSFTTEVSHEGADSGKGYSKIVWNGSFTDQADVTNFQLWGYAGSGHQFEDFNDLTPTISTDGKYLIAVGVNTTGSIKYYTFIYDKAEIEAAGDPLTVMPLNIFAMDMKLNDQAYFSQGVASDGLFIYSLRGFVNPLFKQTIDKFDFVGNWLASAEVDLPRGQYTRDELLDNATLGVPRSSEPEGLCMFGDELLVISVDNWKAVGDVVTHEGLTYAAIADSTGADPADSDSSTDWVLTDKADSAGVWDAVTAYTAGAATLISKLVYSVKPPTGDSGEQALNSGVTNLNSEASLVLGNNAHDITFPEGQNLQISSYSQNGQVYKNQIVIAGHKYELHDSRSGADNSEPSTIYSVHTDTEDSLELRATDVIANGSGINLHGDNDALGGIITFFTAGVKVLQINDVDTLAVRPGTDNTQNLGTGSFRWKSGHIQELRPGDGTALWTTGTGTPEGAITAVVGSMYTDTAGGAGTTLYVKETGAGNTGWVAK